MILLCRSSPNRKGHASGKYPRHNHSSELEDEENTEFFSRLNIHSISPSYDSPGEPEEESQLNYRREKLNKVTPPRSPVQRRLESDYEGRYHAAEIELIPQEQTVALPKVIAIDMNQIIWQHSAHQG